MDNLQLALNQLGTSQTCPTVFLFKDDRILIGLRHYTPDKWKSISVWTVPGGRCDSGEKIEDTLRREVAEEVGITKMEITGFLGVVQGAKEGDVVYVFKGTTHQEPTLVEPEKFSEWKWCVVTEVPENFISPKSLELVRNSL